MIGIIGIIGILFTGPHLADTIYGRRTPLRDRRTTAHEMHGGLCIDAKYIVSASSNYHPCVIGKKLETSLTAIIRVNFGYGTRANVLFCI